MWKSIIPSIMPHQSDYKRNAPSHWANTCARVCVCIWSQSKHTIQKQTIQNEFRKLRCMKMKDVSVAFSQFWYKFVARYLHSRTISNSYIVLCVITFEDGCYRCPIQMYIYFLSNTLVKPIQSLVFVCVYCPLNFPKEEKKTFKYLPTIYVYKWNV